MIGKRFMLVKPRATVWIPEPASGRQDEDRMAARKRTSKKTAAKPSRAKKATAKKASSKTARKTARAKRASARKPSRAAKSGKSETTYSDVRRSLKATFLRRFL
jgi:hypothetical protein